MTFCAVFEDMKKFSLIHCTILVLSLNIDPNINLYEMNMHVHKKKQMMCYSDIFRLELMSDMS